MAFIVAIDGPAGSGKGTVTKLLAQKQNLINIDTGAMYRCVALECFRKNIDSTEISKINEILKSIKIELKRENGNQIVYLNGENVSKEIRTQEIDDCVAKFAAVKEVREKVKPIQREMGKFSDIIMEGRDIGTVVFPDADVKIFLDCSVEERAKRRYNQYIEKGIKITYEEVLESIIERHKMETERDVDPFIKADDAILIDSTNMNINEVVDEIEKIIIEARNKNK